MVIPIPLVAILIALALVGLFVLCLLAAMVLFGKSRETEYEEALSLLSAANGPLWHEDAAILDVGPPRTEVSRGP